MKINQLNDKYGSGEIVFTDEEIEIIKEKKKILLAIRMNLMIWRIFYK